MSLAVIVANYNNGKYIRECLESIVNQTYQDLEIVVSDDCSSDDSPEIIKKFEKKFPDLVKGIFSPFNRGVALNRHEAICSAKAEYITTLDSDDYYCDLRKLENEMALVTSYKKKFNKDIIAFSNIVFIREDKTLMYVWGNQENIKEGMIFDSIMSRSGMIPRDFIMKKDCYFEVGGYDHRFPVYEDWDLKIRLAQKYEFYYTGINGTAYRRHGKGLSSLPRPEHVQWLEIIFNKNLHLAKQPEIKKITKGFYDFISTLKITN